MMLSVSYPTVSCPCTARWGSRVARIPLQRLQGILTGGQISSNQSFVKRHQEVLNDSEWFGPEVPDHPVSPAAVAAAPATAAKRSDIRLMNGFTTFLKSHKMDLSAIFCSESLLSADSRVVCDLQAGHHGELLAEYLTSGNLRVGEELPHWFVNGNIRGAIKCWMATRPAAAVLAEARGAAAAAAKQQLQQPGSPPPRLGNLGGRQTALAASVASQGPLGSAARSLVDQLLAAMPAWQPGSVQEMAGWEPSDQATAEDVALLHCFGCLVYSARLDVTEFLQQLCGADPFSWVMAQVAQGVISEPEPWLLERFFMSRHSVGEDLPLWFVKWGIREEICKWLGGQQAFQLVQSLMETRGGALNSLDVGGLTTPAAAAAVATAAMPSGRKDGDVALLEALAAAGPEAAKAAMLDRLEAAAAGLMSYAASTGMPHVHCRRAVKMDTSSTSYPADFVAVAEGVAGLVAAVVVLENGRTADHAPVVRQAKARLDWLGFLLQWEQGLASSAVSKVLLVVGEEGDVQALPQNVLSYLSQSGVRLVTVKDLP